MTTKKYSKGYGDRFPGPSTSAKCIWEACIAFHTKNGAPPTYEYIKNLTLNYIDKKGGLRFITSENQIKTEISSYKQFCKRFPDAKQLEILKKTPDYAADNNNTLDIYDNYQDIQKAEDQHIFPDEVQDTDNYCEGAKQTVVVNSYERNPKARSQCIERYKAICGVCEFNFEKKYGEIGAGFIHVHHLTPLANIGREYKVDPIKDLIPVCPNCHAMLHRKHPPFSIEELKSFIKIPDNSLDIPIRTI